MRLLVVGSGASYATKDVEVGYFKALEALGHDLIPFALDHRIDAASDYLRYIWRRNGKPQPRPDIWDAAYLASQGALELALWHEVDGVLVISAQYLSLDSYKLFRKAHIRTAAIFTESPYQDEVYRVIVPYLDCAWTNERTTAKRLGIRYLPACYDPDIHQPEDDPELPSVLQHDVVFVGSGWPERRLLLSAVNWSGLDFGLYGDWHELPARSKLRGFLRDGVVNNRVAAQLYRNARVVLNLYRDSAGAESLNPRAYEIAACGAFQISSYRAEVQDIFADSVPTFEKYSLEEVIRWTLALTPDKRMRFSEASRDFVQPHTFDARARKVERDLYSAWGLSPVHIR